MELRRGMPRSEATAKWQEWLRIPDDGFFGPVTQAFTKQFQGDQKLPVTGIVDKATWYTMAALRDDVFDDVGISALPGSKVTFMQARNFTAANRIAEKRIKHVVIHTMEAAEASTTAENVARWFAGANAPKASAHFCIDNDTIVQCVRLRDVAWHAPGANASGIGLEHAGYARQTREQWSDEYSERMLGLSAALAAALCVRFSIPVGFVDAEGLKRGEAGVTTHHEVSRAFKKSDHYDPGPNFPMDEYLAAVQRAVIDTGLLGLP
jgi:N-acetyl-anhydromuramyl-L-alanine amidase AmpD